MHLSFRLIFLLFCCGPSALAQSRKDSVATLNEVVVSAYSYHRTLKETPVALGIVGEKELSRFNVTSMVSAMNTVPGVRMEERSPGSYRFSIRGSALRSPFGVRNVKFYWNGLPLTDGGGNTYLNLLDVEAIGKAEIIKGQGASLYGAGTGGVVLLTSPSSSKNQFQFSSSGGSFGLQRHQAGAFFANDKNRLFVNYVHQQSEGYREQSAMRRDALNLSGNYSLRNKSVLHTSVFYSDLYYQTPGGLTLAQYTVDPKQARLPSKTTAGAVQQHAAIYNKTIYGAAVYESQWASRWSTRAGLYSAYTDFTNPSILNFERRTEYNWGGRTDTRYELDKNNWKAKFTMGAEYQHFYSPLTDYGNRLGAKDTLQTDDRLTSNLIVLFAQAEFDLPHHFYFTIGSSTNFLNFNFHRLTGSQPGQQRNFDPVISPRVALLKKLNENFSVFASVNKGFSPPTLAEVRPSSGVYNNTLSPEQGMSYEFGMRGKLLKAFSFDVVAFDFELTNTIVGQNNGATFINAGSTSQRGLETSLVWQPQNRNYKFWIAHTLANYNFLNYQHDGVTYSGNQLTGTSRNVVVSGADVYYKKFYCNLTAYFVERTPLNDANSIFASDYFLAGSRIGFKDHLGKSTIEIFVGVDNAFDQRYSLGNDLNAAASRYFNAATARNFYFGVKIKI